MAITVLLVERNTTTSDLLAHSLQQQGYQVLVAHSQREALSRARSSHPDLLVLDVASFKANGHKVAEVVRSQLNGVPTILLVEQGHAGVGGAAEGIMEPPFTSRKLLYRVRKLAEKLPSREMSLGSLVLDADTGVVRNGDKAAQLRPKEAELLAFFMRNPGKVLSRQEIMRQVWDTDYVEDTRTLNVHVCWLRRKLEEAGTPRLLRTIRRSGYRLDMPGSGS